MGRGPYNAMRYNTTQHNSDRKTITEEQKTAEWKNSQEREQT
jgi:hypothetical protein